MEFNRIYSICPNISPAFLDFDYVNEYWSAVDGGFDNCASVLGEYDCINDLNFQPIGTLTYLSSIPASTGTVDFPTTTTDGGSITTPLLGAVYTFTALDGASTITAVQATGSMGSGSGGSSSSTATTHRSVFNVLVWVGLAMIYDEMF